MGAVLHTTNDKGEGLLAGRTSGEYEYEMGGEVEEVFGELVARGVDGRGEDGGGRSAVDVVVGRGNVGILELFGEGGGKGCGDG